MDRDFRHLSGVCSMPGELRPFARTVELEVVRKAEFHRTRGSITIRAMGMLVCVLNICEQVIGRRVIIS